MLVINSAFEIRLENAGVKFYSYHFIFKLVIPMMNNAKIDEYINNKKDIQEAILNLIDSEFDTLEYNNNILEYCIDTEYKKILFQ